MITKITVPCKCGASEPKDFVEYDGSLGYEAVICKHCGRYFDLGGSYEANEFSRTYLKQKGV